MLQLPESWGSAVGMISDEGYVLNDRRCNRPAPASAKTAGVHAFDQQPLLAYTPSLAHFNLFQ